MQLLKRFWTSLRIKLENTYLNYRSRDYKDVASKQAIKEFIKLIKENEYSILITSSVDKETRVNTIYNNYDTIDMKSLCISYLILLMQSGDVGECIISALEKNGDHELATLIRSNFEDGVIAKKELKTAPMVGALDLL